MRTILAALLAVFVSAHAADDVVFADFERADYGAWKTTGEAFGPGPANGTLAGQMHVDGFAGKGLVNSFLNGDKTTGTLVSPEFKVERKFVTFLIGGGGFAGQTCMNLVIDGKAARTATGPNTQAGGSEMLERQTWDVSEFGGKMARIEIIDSATGGWGHINADHIVFTDTKPPAMVSNRVRELAAQNTYLHLPVKTGGPKRKMSVKTDSGDERKFDIELADGAPDWWAFMDIGAWRGKTLKMSVDKLPENSTGLSAIEQSDALKNASEIYREPLRGQLHFSARRGWLNDPNGMVFFEGQYHLFFQHNPYGWAWGNMHWGHAVSRNLITWEEQPETLYPDSFGAMFSGSAVVDWKNTSGLGKDGVPPIVLIYTAAGADVQCLAYSTDKGKTFTKYSGNPVLKKITGGNRDPKVLWHEPTQKWVMTLYVEVAENQKKIHTIQFFTSADLKEWTQTGRVDGLFECPDLFELPIEEDRGKANQTKWVLTAADSDYMIGTFDGANFTPETPKLKGHRGKGFYAAQTFSDIPANDTRRIQIGWLQTATPGMPFNQSMSLPHWLSLITTPEGLRLAFNPVGEIGDVLGSSSAGMERLTVRAGEKPVALPEPTDMTEQLEIRVLCTPGAASEINFNIRGIPIVYDSKKQELSVNGHKASAPLQHGQQNMWIYVDRTALEIFASGGLTYVPMPVLLKAADKTMNVSVKGDDSKLDVYVKNLNSIWRR